MIESQRRLSHHIQVIEGKLRNGCARSILRITESGKEIEATTRDKLEQLLLAHNEDKYRQCCNYPIFHGYQEKDIDFYGEKKGTQEILNGTYVSPPRISIHIQQLIKKPSNAKKYQK